MESRIRRFGIGGLATLITLTIAGCRDVTSPDNILPGLTVRTDAETIHFEQFGGANGITVPITVSNNSDLAVSLAYCGEVLERFTIRGWEMVYAPICLASIQPLPPIPPGTSLALTVRAYDASGPDPRFRFTDSPNVYRVNLALWMIVAGTVQPLPTEARVTNPFYVEP